MLLLLKLVLLGAPFPPDAGSSKRQVVIQAEHGFADNKAGTRRFEGNVVAVRDTLRLTCRTLDAFVDSSGEIERIVAQGDVLAVDGSRSARGNQAVFVNDGGVLTMTGTPQGKDGEREVDGEVVTFVTGVDRLTVTKARTRAVSQDGKRIQIDADKLVFEGPQNVATWSGHVRATKGKTTLLTPLLLAYSNASGEIIRVKAKGGVEVTEPGRWGQGQFADYDVEAGRLVVTGNPQARDGKTRLKGSQVIFKSGSEFLEVENPVTVIEVDRKASQRP